MDNQDPIHEWVKLVPHKLLAAELSRKQQPPPLPSLRQAKVHSQISHLQCASWIEGDPQA
jgi:hypothetical protein